MARLPLLYRLETEAKIKRPNILKTSINAPSPTLSLTLSLQLCPWAVTAPGTSFAEAASGGEHDAGLLPPLLLSSGVRKMAGGSHRGWRKQERPPKYTVWTPGCFYQKVVSPDSDQSSTALTEGGLTYPVSPLLLRPPLQGGRTEAMAAAPQHLVRSLITHSSSLGVWVNIYLRKQTAVTSFTLPTSLKLCRMKKGGFKVPSVLHAPTPQVPPGASTREAGGSGMHTSQPAGVWLVLLILFRQASTVATSMISHTHGAYSG